MRLWFFSHLSFIFISSQFEVLGECTEKNDNHSIAMEGGRCEFEKKDKVKAVEGCFYISSYSKGRDFFMILLQCFEFTS